jgi:hypothetical protein
MSNLLDNDYANFIDLKEKNILWEGTPNPPFLITYLASSPYHDSMSGGTGPFILLITATIFVSSIFYNAGSMLGMICSILVGLFFFIKPDIIKYKRKKKIAYSILEDGIYFQLSGWKKEQTDFIPFDNIKRITTLPMKTGEGDLIVYTKEAVSFITYDFNKNAPMPCPTLIKIKDVKEVSALIRKKINN